MPHQVLLPNGLTAEITPLGKPSMIAVRKVCQQAGCRLNAQTRFFALTVNLPNKIHFIYANWINGSCRLHRILKKTLEAGEWGILEEVALIVYEGRAFHPTTRHNAAFTNAVRDKISPNAAALLAE